MSEASEVGRRGLVIGAVVVAVAAGIVFATTRRNEGADAAGDAEAQATGQMAGMEMSTDGTIRLTTSQLSEFGVTFATVEVRPLQDEVRTVGIVALDETRVAQVTLKYGGFVERLHVDFTGRSVRRGEPLLDIYSPDLVSAQEELLLAARLDATVGRSAVPGVPSGGSRMAEVARRRLSLWDVPDAEIDEILASGRVRRAITVRAPVSGVVVDKQVVQGQAVEPGQPLYTVADLSRVWVEAELREPDAADIRAGATATVELAAFPGRSFPGVVEYVYPTLSEPARTLKARIVLASAGGEVKPGMYATVRLSGPVRSTLTVPSAAVVHTGVRHLVFVDLGAGRLLPQEIQMGRTAGDLTEIVAGLEPGQRIVTSAQYLLDSESNLAEVMRSMIGQGGAAMDADMPGMDMPAEVR